MKRISFILLLALIGMSSCCKVDLAVGVHVTYPAINYPVDLVVLTLHEADTTTYADTVAIISLNEGNNFGTFVELDNSPFSDTYVLSIETAGYSDTITDYTYETKGFNCNIRVTDVEYNLNGQKRTGSNLIIN